MLLLAADLDEVRARADHFGQRQFRVELRTQLVEIRDALAGAATHRAAVGFDLAQDQLQQRRLARPVRADQADPVAAHDPGREIAHDDAIVIALDHVGELGHHLAALLALVHGELHVAEPVATGRTLAPQGLQSPHAAFVAGAAGFDTLAYPDLLLREHLVEARGGLLLGLEFLGLAPLIVAEAPWVAAEAAAIELDDAGRDMVQEHPVMGDHDHGAAKVADQALEPQDAVDVQVIGRLVQQQQIRLAHQRAGQRDALHAAAGQAADRHVSGEPQLQQDIFHPLIEPPCIGLFHFMLQCLQSRHRVVVMTVGHRMHRGVIIDQQPGRIAETVRDRREHVPLEREVRLLRHIGDLQAVLSPDGAVVEHRLTGQGLEQAGFSGTVAPDQRNALARIQLERRMIQQGHMPEGEAGVVHRQKRHGDSYSGNERSS